MTAPPQRGRRRLGRRHLAWPVAAFLGIACILPVLLLVVFSGFEVDEDTFQMVPALSGRAWAEFMRNPAYGSLIGKAVTYGLSTAALAALLGYPLALAVVRLPASWKGVALIVLLTPLYTGDIVRVYAWRVMLGTEGLVNAVLLGLHIVDRPVQALLFTPFATHLVLLYNTLPFMVLAIWVSAERIDRRLLEAARDLGARPLQAFARVTLPLTTPGLAAGALAVFALSAGDLTTPSLLGGTSGATAMATIDNLFGTAFDWPLAAVVALVLLAALLASAVAMAGAVLALGRGRAARPGRSP
ncbi:ABC transporter permease [uncultured Methylobacterium sp.]|uniref:ABC transporter permease n=1 Tax=uncultured Methylobacterium sp. TaxID=157278 RepID=UPI0035CB323D